jgi:hypothetical protein
LHTESYFLFKNRYLDAHAVVTKDARYHALYARLSDTLTYLAQTYPVRTVAPYLSPYVNKVRLTILFKGNLVGKSRVYLSRRPPSLLPFALDHFLTSSPAEFISR